MRAALDRSPGDQPRQSFLASMGQMFRRLLEMHGLDAVRIARDAGVDLAVIPAPGERIEVDKIDAILRIAIPLIAAPAIGAGTLRTSPATAQETPTLSPLHGWFA